MGNSATSNADKIYTLLHAEKNEADVECKRLTDQYYMLKGGLQRTSPVPPELDLSKISSVLDVAAGNCIWILDFASQPEIECRVQLTEPSIELHACDIDLGKFPPSARLSKKGVKGFQHDVTRPFPEEMRHRFDLIHMSILIGALSSKQWEVAIRNLRDALSMSSFQVCCCNSADVRYLKNREVFSF